MISIGFVYLVFVCETVHCHLFLGVYIAAIFLFDIGLDVKISKQTQHDDHVVAEEILAPHWEVTPAEVRLSSVGERYQKLHLKIGE